MKTAAAGIGVFLWITLSAAAAPLPRCALATHTQLLCPHLVEPAADIYYRISRSDPDIRDPYNQRIIREAGCMVTHERAGLEVKASRLGSQRIAEPDGTVRVLSLHLYHGLTYAVPEPMLKGKCPRYLNGPTSVIGVGPGGSDYSQPEFYPSDTSQIFCAKRVFEPMVRMAVTEPDAISDRDFARAVHDGRCYTAPRRSPYEKYQ